jgi:hypothetical protein
MRLDILKREILEQLPQLIEEDREFRLTLTRMLRGEFADKQQTESRIEQLLDELRRDREANERKWDEAQAESRQKWDEAQAESRQKWEEQNRKWEEQNRKWDEAQAESRQKWEEQNRKWDEAQAESNRKWEANRREFDRVHEEIMAMSKRIDRTIGALGARWGVSSERSFRNALAGILTDAFGVEVVNVSDFDTTGSVFGRPEQIELDIIIRNGTLIILELKSSVSKPEIYVFERKARWYEERHQRKADRLVVISPMVDARAMDAARKLGVTVYSDPEDMPVVEP